MLYINTFKFMISQIWVSWFVVAFLFDITPTWQRCKCCGARIRGALEAESSVHICCLQLFDCLAWSWSFSLEKIPLLAGENTHILFDLTFCRAHTYTHIVHTLLFHWHCFFCVALPRSADPHLVSLSLRQLRRDQLSSYSSSMINKCFALSPHQ